MYLAGVLCKNFFKKFFFGKWKKKLLLNKEFGIVIWNYFFKFHFYFYYVLPNIHTFDMPVARGYLKIKKYLTFISVQVFFLVVSKNSVV